MKRALWRAQVFVRTPWASSQHLQKAAAMKVWDFLDVEIQPDRHTVRYIFLCGGRVMIHPAKLQGHVPAHNAVSHTMKSSCKRSFNIT